MEAQARYAIPSRHVIDDEVMVGTLQEPIPPGGALPQLDLARQGGIQVASGVPFQVMPDPGKPPIVWPDLTGSPDRGGYDPENPSPPAPNLAGIDGIPSPADLMRKVPQDVILSDARWPDFASLNVTLKPYDLDAGLNYSYGNEFAADPFLPDLTEYCQPMGLDIHNMQGTGNALFRPDPYLNDLIGYDVPGGIDVIDHPLDPDPQLPDLQNPQLTPDVRMRERPGDLANNAMSTMYDDPTYDQVEHVGYDVSYMTQAGYTTRGRRFDLLMHGLEEGN